MAKAGGTYPSIIYGVSESQPQHRRPGQMTEQVNMLSDPTHGLVRRRGTRYAARIAAPGLSGAEDELQRMDVFDFSMNGREYALLHRRHASSLPKELFAFLYDKTGETFLPINYENSTWVDTLVSGGVSAITAAGGYVYIAGNETVPTAEQENVWDTTENMNLLAAWFRTGKYSTTYKVSLIREDGTRETREYTTKPSAYPEALDTSDIEFYLPGTTDPDPEYQKHVNDRVNEYNGKVTAWIKEAAEDIVPENIAQQIADQFIVDGFSVTSVENGGFLVNDPEFVDIEVDDGGDNTTVYAVGREISDATRVTKYHFHGKIVRVRPRNAGADEAYYLEARLDDGRESGYGAVSWFEVAGVYAEITGLFAQMIIHDGEAYIARDGLGLSSIAPDSGEHPTIRGRVVGDGLTSPLPWYIGRPITMLAMFQDRLLIGSENYINASRAGDYLNFFRGSVLDISDSDPVEVFAHGSEGDVLRYAIPYNGDLIIFGEQQQYGISGDTMFTPRAPLVKPISANKDAVETRPVVSGNYIFYSQHGLEGTTLHQMRVHALDAEAVVTDELSDDLGSWLSGDPLQISAVTAPNLVMFRTAAHKDTMYLYRYHDDKNNGQRVIEAWHKFTYNPALGTIVAVSSFKKSGIVFTARPGYLVADIAVFDGDDYSHACIDSRVPFADRAVIAVPEDECVAVVGRSHEGYLLGTPMHRYDEFIAQMPDAEEHLEFGVVSDAHVTPTNPFPRDHNGQAILEGRMTLNRVSVDVEETGGMMADVSTSSGVIRTTDFEGRVMGNTLNVLGKQPLYTGQLNVSVGREVKSCAYTIRSKDWLPLRITGLSWVGQVFNHVQRVG